MTVSWKKTLPPGDRNVALNSFQFPVHAVLVARFAGPCDFVDPPTQAVPLPVGK